MMTANYLPKNPKCVVTKTMTKTLCSASCGSDLSRGPSPRRWRRGGCSRGTRPATPRPMEANPRCDSDVGDRSGVRLPFGVLCVSLGLGLLCSWQGLNEGSLGDPQSSFCLTGPLTLICREATKKKQHSSRCVLFQ